MATKKPKPENKADAIHGVYMDACCFIDLAKSRLGVCPEDRNEDIFFLQQLLRAAEKKAVKVFSSTLSIAECLNAGKEHPSDVRAIFDSILQSGYIVTIVEVSPFIATAARDMIVEGSLTLKPPDAIHMATAIEMGCKEFITTDLKGPIKNHSKILKLGVSVIRAHKTRYLPSKFRQMEISASSSNSTRASQ